EMQEEIAELKRRLKPDPPASPSTCKLKVVGPLDGDVARLEAEFKFKIENPKTLVTLGCQGAHPRRPELDGKEALLRSEEDGFLVQADAGEHVLTVELEVPVGPRGAGLWEGTAERGFRLKLPGAAVTTLELGQLPNGVKEVRVGQAAVRKAGESVALGAVDQLNVAWKKPARAETGPRLTADGQVTVRVEEKFVLNEAVLTLQDRRGQARQWVLQTPLQTAVEVKAGEEQGPVAVTSDKNQSRHTLQVKEPTAQPLEVVLRAMRPRSA